MKSEVKTFSYPNGEIQRVHLVCPDDWSGLELLHPVPAEGALDCFAQIYRQHLVPAAPWVFGNIVLFRLPADLPVPFPFFGTYGKIWDPLTAAAVGLKKGVTMAGGKPRFRDEQTRKFWKELEMRGCIRIVRGKLSVTTVIPVGPEAGLLTETEPAAAMKVNSSFFIMDPLDCATPYDHIGIPFGLFVKDGEILQPPLFSREALLVRTDGAVTVEQPKIENLSVEIGGTVYRHGGNARFYTRPRHGRVFLGGDTGLVVIGRRVAAVCRGSAAVPGSGFVIRVRRDCGAKPGDLVTYHGLEDVVFGIQVGNSILRDGVKTERFISKFFNVKGLWRTAFPPSLYPLDFQKARAARIAIGADRDGKPMILWAEGAAKIGHVPGADSCGATLADMARICEELGMVNAVNLDGGGSAQILLKNKRSLQISDRNDDLSERERPVPLGLMIR